MLKNVEIFSYFCLPSLKHNYHNLLQTKKKMHTLGKLSKILGFFFTYLKKKLTL